MAKPTITIHDCSTDEIIVREMNDDEYSQHQIDLANAEAKEQAKAETAAAKAALLAKLGITEDEARLLLGGN